ncbi:glutathione S-transferase family protein [Kocuria sp.]|uniref:glutathione S-transferase family protein n=1 Tax=Kocuria sp. TaxID=1871328 RepID=UPI0026DB5D97|nr:glutathione S-transferase C-terminal domain-containing protein [Kocuria sp.]MDO4918189.1 glutathione S-transferase C-terminal domain-containing protein [Kocuria sp.]
MPRTNSEKSHSTAGMYVHSGEEYTRDTTYIEDRIVADPEHAHLAPGAQAWPVEAGRYRLIAARACPWANRTLIVRRLLGLEDAISVGMPGPTHDARSWRFDLDPDGRDPVLGTERLQENYFARFPDYPRGITVPAIVDIPSGGVVTNDFEQITEDFSTQWRDHQREGAPELWPEDLVDEMRPVMRRIYTEINNGVYRCGFAGSQEAYDKAYDRLWTAMDWVEDRLSGRRYLMGDHITEADVRLFTTLVRFDPVYVSHFKASRNKLTEMPNLWGYARDLFQTPGFGDTVDFQQIKEHYFVVHEDINPSQIVPLGPALENWTTPHGREALGGSPFAPGATAPGPVRAEERVTAGHNPLVP